MGFRPTDRRLRLETAIEGCEIAGIPYVISVHPAEKARFEADLIISRSVSLLLTRVIARPLESSHSYGQSFIGATQFEGQRPKRFGSAAEVTKRNPPSILRRRTPMKRMRLDTRHLASRRVLLLILSFTAGLLAILLPGPANVVLAVFALAGFASLILIISIRLSDTVSDVKTSARNRGDSASTDSHSSQKYDDRSAVRVTSAFEMLWEAGHRLESESDLPNDLLEFWDTTGPLVSVVVPCFNEAQFVAETLRSVLNQSFTNWECIVIDDASTDRSLGEIWSITSKDDRFRVLRHRVNSGLSAARNTGLRAARGRYVTFLDGDDLLMTESLMDRVLTLANHTNDPHILGSYCGVTMSPQEVELDDMPRRMKFESGRVVDFITADSECPFSAHAPMVLTDRLRALGGFEESMRSGAEDWDLWYRALRNGYTFVPSRYTTAVYRQKRRSMVRTMPDAHVSEADRLINAAHQPCQPSILAAPTPTPLTRPIGEYQALLHRSDRAIRFAAMALVAGDELAATGALGVMKEVPLALVARHFDLPDLMDRGMMRALVLSSRELRTVEPLTHLVPLRLTELLKAVSEEYEPEPIDPVAPPSVGALLIPQQAGQVSLLMGEAQNSGFTLGEIAILDIEREGGRQGVREAAPAEVQRWSLNQWVLLGGICDAAFLGSVRTGVVEQIARALAATGVRVIAIEEENSHLMRLPEAEHKVLTEHEEGMRSFSDLMYGPASISRGGDPASWWVLEEYPDTDFDALDISRFQNRHRGERVVIIGNGPSLNGLDLTCLKTEHTIAVNGIFYAADRMGFDPSYYVVEDTAVMRDNLSEIIAYPAGHKFFPSLYRKMVGEHPDISYFMMNRGFYEPRSPDFCIPRFSTDPTQLIFSGQSVTLINLQLAYFMGFDEVVLIGMDFSYRVPPDAIVDGDIITSTSGDPNHFHPDYFGPGKVWKDPRLDRVLANYALAKQMYEQDGRRIVNATPGGKLDLFERIEYDRAFI